MLLKTMPYLVFRAMVYFGIALGYVLLCGIGAGIGYGVGSLGGPDGQAGGAFWGGLIGFGVGSGIMFFLREYLLYVVKAGHIAVLVELLDGRPLPDGKGQVAYGTSVVKQRFVQSSVLFALDRLLKGVIQQRRIADARDAGGQWRRLISCGCQPCRPSAATAGNRCRRTACRPAASATARAAIRSLHR